MMHLLTPLLLLTATPTLSAPLLPRSAQGVYDSVTAIDTAVKDLITALTPYNGGILTLPPFSTASIKIHAVNREGFARATASDPFSSADSKRIVDHVNDSVGVSIPQSIDLLESKKEFFDQDQFSSVVLAFVELLRYDHDTFSLAVGGKLSADQAAGGAAAAGKIDAVLAGAEAYYAV